MAPDPAPVISSSGSLSTTDLRRLWPQVLDEVKNRRRFTWILLSQNSSVVDLQGEVLTLGLANPGARESFGKGGSTEVLREAILAVIGVAVRIETVLDATADAAAGRGSAPAANPASSPSPAAPRSAAAESARQEIRPTRSAGSPASAEQPEPEPDRTDEVVAEDSTSSEELLMKHLGAELIDPS